MRKSIVLSLLLVVVVIVAGLLIAPQQATGQGLVEYALVQVIVGSAGNTDVVVSGQPCPDVCSGVAVVKAKYDAKSDTVLVEHVWKGLAPAAYGALLGPILPTTIQGELTYLDLKAKPVGGGQFDTTISGTTLIHLNGATEFAYAVALIPGLP